MKLFDLSGRSAIVTGANTGIGRSIAIALAEAGAAVVGVGRSSMDETSAAIKAQNGKFFALRADLSQMDDVRRVIPEASSLVGATDILVNNAGIIRRNDSVNFTEADWDEVMDTNLKAVFFLCQQVAKNALEAKRRTKIINIASLLSFQGGIRVASYTASKSGVAGLTKLLANEWAPLGINVNAIAPGYVETNNTEALLRDEKRSAEILARIPAGRWGRPEDIGGAAVFLASDASDYVHGTILPVDGGWLGR